MRMHWFRVGLFAVLAALPLTAAAQSSDYVVSAAGWGSTQANAVAAAGGTVVYASSDAGVAVVRSTRADFLSRLRNSGAVESVNKDVTAVWIDPFVGGTINANFSNPPNNDRFFNNIQWAPQAIDAPAAWAEGCTGQGARVAVLDGGIWNVPSGSRPELRCRSIDVVRPWAGVQYRCRHVLARHARRRHHRRGRQHRQRELRRDRHRTQGDADRRQGSAQRQRIVRRR